MRACCRRSARYVRAPHRISILRPARSSETSLVHGRGPWAAQKGLVNARRRCVEARALPAGGLLSDGVSRGSPPPGARSPRPSRRARARRRRLPCTSSCPPPPAPRGGGRAWRCRRRRAPGSPRGRPRRAPGPSGGACTSGSATPTPPVPSWRAGCPSWLSRRAARSRRSSAPTGPARTSSRRPGPSGTS